MDDNGTVNLHNQRIKILLEQITRDRKKSDRISHSERASKIAACEELQELLISLDSEKSLDYSWNVVAHKLLNALSPRTNPEVKQAISNCLGALGYLLIADYNQYLSYLLKAVNIEKHVDDRALIFKAICFSIKQIGIHSKQTQIAPQSIDEIMIAMKHWLEVNESTSVLISLLDTCAAVAQYFPIVFKKSFDDIVDFTVGWYIEPSQPNAVLAKCNEMLMQLGPFWLNAVPSAITLMKQFLDDATVYIENLSVEDNSEAIIKNGKNLYIEQILDKTAALMRALATMLNVIKICERTQALTSFADKIFERISQHLNQLENIKATKLNIVFEQYLNLMCAAYILNENAESLLIVSKSVRLMYNHPSKAINFDCKLLSFHEKLIDRVQPGILKNVMESIHGDKGYLRTINVDISSIGRAYCNLLSKLFSFNTLPVLQATYDYVTGDLLRNFTSMKARTELRGKEIRSMENRIILDLNALCKLAVIRNSMIAMMGLSPSLFSFLTNQTPIVEKWFIVYYPDCHYALLTVLKTHSEKHENFVASSNLLMTKNRLSFVAEAPTANYTTTIFNITTKLLQLDDIMWPISRNLIIDWLNGLTFGVSSDVLNLNLDKPEIVKLRQALLNSFLKYSLPKKGILESAIKYKDGYTHETRSFGSRVRHFTLLRRLAVFDLTQNEPSKFVDRIFKNSRFGAPSKITGIWQAVPPSLFLQNGLTQKAYDTMEFSQTKFEEAAFKANHFMLIAEFLLNSVIPTYCMNNSDDGNWLEDTASIIYNSTMNKPATNLDIVAKWRWIFTQVAQFCVENRMKTPLGKTLDTFLAFENAIRRLAAAVVARKPLEEKDKADAIRSKTVISRRKHAVNGNEDKDEDEIESDDLEKTPQSLSNGEHWWRVRALLETLELLDKAMSYASDGAVFQLMQISSASQQFFITNHASCTSWLLRLYLPMMAVAFASGNYTQVVRIGEHTLRDAKRRAISKQRVQRDEDANHEKEPPTEFDSVAHTCISWIVKALIELSRPQALFGLYAFVKTIYRTNDWIKYAAEMANGRIENAIDGWLICLNEQKIPDGVSKTIRELLISAISHLRNPDECDRIWQSVCGTVAMEKIVGVTTDFEKEAWKSVNSLMKFDSNVKEDAIAPIQWDVKSRFAYSELKLINIANQGKENKNEIMELTRQFGDDARLLMMADTNFDAHTHASALHLLLTALKDSRKPSHKQQVTKYLLKLPVLKQIVEQNVALNYFNPAFLYRADNGPILQRVKIAQQFSFWLEHTQTPEKTSSLKIIADEESFHLGLSKMARKLGNLRLANRQLCLHLSKNNPELSKIASQYLNDILVGTNTSNGNGWQLSAGLKIWNNYSLTSVYEAAKTIWAASCANKESTGGHRDAFAILSDSVASTVDDVLIKGDFIMHGAPMIAPDALVRVISQQLNPVSVVEDPISAHKQSKAIILAKTILCMAQWLETNPSLMQITLDHSIRIAWHMFRSEELRLPLLDISNSSNSMVGALLATSCKLAPHMAKAHAKFGDWAYECAMKCQEDGVGMVLTSEERDIIVWHLKNLNPSISDIAIESIVLVIRTAQTSNDLVDKLRDSVSKQCDEFHANLLIKNIDPLIQLWRKLKNRLFVYCDLATRSYFTYIYVCGREQDTNNGTIMATLRILHMLVEFHNVLHILIGTEMHRTNEMVWKDIMPQLFARLNHPVYAVRDTVCTILERIATSAPHALCYSAIVGSTQQIVTHNEQCNDEADGDMLELFDELEKKRDSQALNVLQDFTLMSECCARIVKKLQSLYPDLVAHVTEFVKELQRIDMLHEERWSFVLTNLDHEMNRRIAQIEAEKTKTFGNSFLAIDDKKDIVTQKTLVLTSMVYRIVEDLYERTCSPEPETLNEKQFREIHQNEIEQAMETLRINKTVPRKAWTPFKQLLTHLNNRAGKRNVMNLQMIDISPKLAKLVHTQIPIPGQEEKVFKDVVMLEKIGKQTVVLPTKTRPRRFAFLGSDGTDHAFLFKGQEDLHLDERIMQLLRICNLMLTKKNTEWPPYSAKHYSVTPLGSRSGLIEWVDGATPMFQLYRKWQIRRMPATTTTHDAERPSEIFFHKLKSAFQANKITPDTINDRDKWPLPILKAVVEELISETPRNLFSRELWLRAGSTDTWFRVVERFARSNAVISMLGSILGLGDRHLDNLLLDLETGNVVHIDYNICFDKGRNLRVPETVPFRLTGNIVNALGPTQIEGTFRLSCEHVLRKLRENKEVLLTILDAFVYDPLVDWAAVQDDLASKSTIGAATMLAVYGADKRREILSTMTHTLFLIRLKEYSSGWLDNKNQLKRILNGLRDTIEKIKRNEANGHTRTEMDTQRLLEVKRSDLLVELKRAMSFHQQMMHEIRPLVRSIATANQEFVSYLLFYKRSFSDPLIKVHKLLEENNPANYLVCTDILKDVIDNISNVYDGLLNMEYVKFKTPSTGGDETTNNDCAMSESAKQKQNIHGRHVSMRVRQKLDGSLVYGRRKLDESDKRANEKPLSPEQQVDLLINEATDINNLALMYEGWTAWV